MDALCHVFESFVSTAASPLTDMAALSAVRLIADNLLMAFQHPESMVYRDSMMMANLMAGLAFSNASLGVVHAMAHSLGGAFDLPHGECNALLLEEAIRFNFDAAADKYTQLAYAMGIHDDGGRPAADASVLPDYIAALRRRLGITRRLCDMKVSLADIPRLADYAVKDPCLATNPRKATQDDIEDIYQRIYE